MADIRQPVPDAGHESLRQSVVQALDELAAQTQRSYDTFLLLLTTADFAQSTLNTAISGQAAIAQLAQAVPALNQQVVALTQQVAALTQRVAVLEG